MTQSVRVNFEGGRTERQNRQGSNKRRNDLRSLGQRVLNLLHVLLPLVWCEYKGNLYIYIYRLH